MEERKNFVENNYKFTIEAFMADHQVSASSKLYEGIPNETLESNIISHDEVY